MSANESFHPAHQRVGGVPTMHLRFVDKKGRYILQQKWLVPVGPERSREEWRDVELVKDAS